MPLSETLQIIIGVILCIILSTIIADATLHDVNFIRINVKFDDIPTSYM